MLAGSGESWHRVKPGRSREEITQSRNEAQGLSQCLLLAQGCRRSVMVSQVRFRM
jgi:hypothetical protein